MQETDLSFLSSEFLDILEHADEIVNQYKQQNQELSFIFSK